MLSIQNAADESISPYYTNIDGEIRWVDEEAWKKEELERRVMSFIENTSALTRVSKVEYGVSCYGQRYAILVTKKILYTVRIFVELECPLGKPETLLSAEESFTG
ncbi:unnamed protein product, partial [Mesorhabditis belari]|uniref:Uncharacterized protein n=1 Tax=Mesorhabditis belari TaxID=2138241 RepID=A0AAF3ER47_9BILA